MWKGWGGRGAKSLPKDILAEILEPRVEEMFSILKQEIYSNGLENSFPSGLVLTGGSAFLDGISDVVEGVFSVPVRLGVPMKIGGLKDVVKNPSFATGVGLVIYGSRNSNNPLEDSEKGLFARLLKRMKQWFKDVI